MASNNQQRARLRRGTNTEGTEQHQSALDVVNGALVKATEEIAKKAEAGDLDAYKALIGLSKDEFERSRSGANDPLLIRLQAIREAGSPMLTKIWGTLYRNVEQPEMEVAERFT